jgi:hypothetical protein
VPARPTAKKFSSRVLGRDWTSVFVAQLPASTGTSEVPALQPGRPGQKQLVTRRPAGNDLPGMLDQFATAVPAGHLIRTKLLTILITNDNRVLIGAVSPAYLEQLALTKAAQ